LIFFSLNLNVFKRFKYDYAGTESLVKNLLKLILHCFLCINESSQFLIISLIP
jgi:hypothetical protein